jgi:hypothetical protein
LREAEEISQGNQVARHALAVQFLTIERGQKVHEIITADLLHAEFSFLQKDVKLHKIAAISGNGVDGQAFFHLHVGYE